MSTIKDKQLQEQLLLQKLRKNVKNKRKTQNDDPPNKKQQNKIKIREKQEIGDKNSDKLTIAAIEEIHRDTKRAAERAELVGTSGWKPTSVKKANKRFLNNTMRSVITHNQRTSEKCKTESRKKYDEITGRKPKFGARTHLFQSAEERMTKVRKD